MADADALGDDHTTFIRFESGVPVATAENPTKPPLT